MEEKRYFSLASYSLVQAIQSFATSLFLCSVYFWTRERYQFTNLQNLLLNAQQGFVYILCSRYGGKLSDRLGYHRQLMICTSAMALTLILGWIPQAVFMPFVIIGMYIIFTASFWPALEAVVMHAPGSTSMPERIGNYNINWAYSAALGFFLSGVLFRWRSDSIFWVAAGLHLLVLFFFRFPIGWANANGQVAMDIPHTGDDIPNDRKRLFLHAAWVGNSLSYMMFASFTAMAPFIGAKFSLSSSTAIWVSSTLFFSRTFSFIGFRRWQGWHYKMFWVVAAAFAAPLSMMLVFFTPWLIAVVLGLACFGMVCGFSYYGSLYYSLDYGENKGEHGGLHEMIIGMGLFAGPLMGALGSWQWGGLRGAQVTVISSALLVAIFGLVLLLWVLSHKGRAPKVCSQSCYTGS
jgi:MFS family permease